MCARDANIARFWRTERERRRAKGKGEGRSKSEHTPMRFKQGSGICAVNRWGGGGQGGEQGGIYSRQVRRDMLRLTDARTSKF